MSIKVSVAKQESRKRDLKRGRIILTIGSDSYHLSQHEADKLIKGLLRALVEIKIRFRKKNRVG